MKVREIELGDVFLMAKIFKKIDFKTMMKEIGLQDVTGLDDGKKEEIMASKSLDFFNYLILHIDEAESDILKLIAAWGEMTPADAAKIKLSEMGDFYKQFVAVNGQEAIASFFKQATGLMQKLH
jgi:hypothetical protein